MNSFLKNLLLFFLPAAMFACGGTNLKPLKESINQLHLKTGQLISCGPPEKEFGSVDFITTCNEKMEFNLAVELLHSFEYDEAEKAFAKIIDRSPQCAMAYWGVAMCNFHPLWEPPTEADLNKGSKAIDIANSITQKSERESGYINAVAAYYKDWNKTDPRTRSINFEKAMEQLHRKYPQDKEATIFYALALDASADPTDKTYTNQKRAGAMLNALYAAEPNHPGIIHYIIHTYDYPGIARLGLPAAKRYAEVAPSSAHALHMPSHIFTRLGLWDDCIQSNTQSVAAAKCYAETAGIKGHWDEELHGLDYLVYAYLQKGDNKAAREQLKYIATITNVYPVNLKGAYTFAAVPSRVALENKNWPEAAALQLHPASFPWNKFPWQEAIVHFARLLGAVHTANKEAARSELTKLNQLHDLLQKQKEPYRSNQVAIQIKAGEAWIQWAAGNTSEALNLMKAAADREDSTSKHPVTPGEVLPARELYADMLLQTQQNEKALAAYEAVLQKSPDRFNSLYGAGVAAERSGSINKAVSYYKQLTAIADSNSGRSELSTARSFLRRHS
jgi:tetratricopeptide (TPR) repeat protein